MNENNPNNESKLPFQFASNVNKNNYNSFKSNNSLFKDKRKSIYHSINHSLMNCSINIARNYLNLQEKKAKSIEEGFEKLQRLSRNLKIIDNNKRNSRISSLIKYDDLFDILEYRGMEKEMEIIDKNLKMKKNKNKNKINLYEIEEENFAESKKNLQIYMNDYYATNKNKEIIELEVKKENNKHIPPLKNKSKIKKEEYGTNLDIYNDKLDFKVSIIPPEKNVVNNCLNNIDIPFKMSIPLKNNLIVNNGKLKNEPYSKKIFNQNEDSPKIRRSTSGGEKNIKILNDLETYLVSKKNKPNKVTNINQNNYQNENLNSKSEKKILNKNISKEIKNPFVKANNKNYNYENFKSNYNNDLNDIQENSNITSNSLISNNIDYNSYNYQNNVKTNGAYSSVSFLEFNSEMGQESEYQSNITNSQYVSYNKNFKNDYDNYNEYESAMNKMSKLIFEKPVIRNKRNNNGTESDNISDFSKNSRLSSNSQNRSYITKSSISDFEQDCL